MSGLSMTGPTIEWVMLGIRAPIPEPYVREEQSFARGLRMSGSGTEGNGMGNGLTGDTHSPSMGRCTLYNAL